MAALHRGLFRCNAILQTNNIKLIQYNACRLISVSDTDFIKRKWISKWKNGFPDQVYSEGKLNESMDDAQIKGYKSVEVMKAVLMNDLDSLKILISKNKDLLNYVHKKSGDSPLTLASRLRLREIAEFLVQSHADIEHKNIDGKRALHEAASAGCGCVIKCLIEHGAQVDVLKRADWTPLMFACAHGHIDCMKLLIQFGADVNRSNKDGWTSFHLACRESHINILNYLLDIDDNCYDTVSKNGRTPLHTACMHGKKSVVEYLLDLPQVKIDAKDSCGATPFLDAVRFNYTDIMDVLIAKNPLCLRHNDYLGKCAVHIAAQCGSLDALKCLVEKYEVDVEMKCDSSMMVPLHFAAKEGHYDLSKYIIRCSGSLHGKDKFGRTALHLSVASNKLNTTQLLIENGADVSMIDSQGKFPADYALSKEMKMLVNEIQKK